MVQTSLNIIYLHFAAELAVAVVAFASCAFVVGGSFGPSSVAAAAAAAVVVVVASASFAFVENSFGPSTMI